MPERWKVDDSEIITPDCPIRVSDFFQNDLVPYSEPVIDRYVRRWIGNPRTRAVLLGILERLSPGRTGDSGNDETVVSRLKEAFRQQQLILLRQRTSGAGAAAAAAAAGDKAARGGSSGAAAAPAKKAKELTWIRFELLDEDLNPLYEEYELTDSSNAVRPARFTKESPSFFRDKIPEGEWKIRFPKLHDNNWKPPGKK